MKTHAQVLHPLLSLTKLLTGYAQIKNDPDQDILIQLSSQLTTLLNSLIKSNPESFICPPAWQRLGGAMQLALPVDDAVARAAFNKIKLRNTRLLVTNPASSQSGRQGRQHLVQLLDSTLQGTTDHDFSSKCWTSMEDKTMALQTAVQWATSPHRPGLAKVYTAARLIESWGRSFGVCATSAILDELGLLFPNDKIRKRLLIRLVGELTRAGFFLCSQIHAMAHRTRRIAQCGRN